MPGGGHIARIIKPMTIRTDKDTHFTGALATNALETENITGIRTDSYLITDITVQSDQQLDWEIYFWGKDTFANTDMDLDFFLGKFRFVASDGVQIAGSNQFYYSTADAVNSFRPIQYIDLDESAELHIGLVNRNATGKNAGATGEIVVEITIEPDGNTQNFEQI